jgi:sugar phosphate isomerase/epimerase
MFGVSTHCLHDHPLETALERLTAVTATVEIMDDGIHYVESAELLERFTFRYFFHAPSRGVNIASQLEPIRKASVEVIAACFAVAGEANADVVIHPGYYAWQAEREAAEEKLRQSLAELKAHAAEHSIRFFIENMPNWQHFFLRSPEELPLIDDIGLALDIGHAHLNDCLDEFLRCPVAHFHIHDNDGREDSHDPVGAGTIDFSGVVAAISQNHAVPIIEVGTFEGAVESIERLKALARR